MSIFAGKDAICALFGLVKVRRIIGNLHITHIMLNDRGSSFYVAEPRLKMFFPLSLLLVVDGNGIIKGRVMAPHLLPAIKDLVAQIKEKGKNLP